MDRHSCYRGQDGIRWNTDLIITILNLIMIINGNPERRRERRNVVRSWGKAPEA